MCIKFAVIGNSRIFATLLKQEAIGRLAQLVQSICLTSRGSAVRIRQRPQNLGQNLVERKLTKTRAFSSAGLEHLPYKQRVGGSNPSTPTIPKTTIYVRTCKNQPCRCFLFYGKAYSLPYIIQKMQPTICILGKNGSVKI